MSLVRVELKVVELEKRIVDLEALINAVKQDLADLLAGPKRDPMPKVKFPKCLEQLGFTDPSKEPKDDRITS